MAEEEKPAAEEPKKKSNKKLFVIIGAVAFIFIAVGAPVLYFTVFKKDSKEELSADAASEDVGSGDLKGTLEEDEIQEGEEPVGALYPLDTFVLNLQDGKFIRAQVQLEFAERDVPKRFLTRAVPLRDELIELLTKRTSTVLLADNGKEEIKKEIKQKINDSLKGEVVKNVYFSQFVIQ